MLKLLRNKRGAGGSIQQQLFLLTELVVGGLLIVGGIFLVTSQVNAAEGEPISKDLSLLISFISHQTEDIAYTYLFPEFVTSISITQEEVIVNTHNGRSSTKLSLNKNVDLKEQNLIDPQTMPIIFLSTEKKIFFETSELRGCAGLRLLGEEKKFRLKIKGQSEELELLKRLKEFLKLKHILLESNERLTNLFEDRSTSTEIELRFNTENDFFISVPRNEPEYEAFSCHIRNNFEGDERIFNELIVEENDEEKLIIRIGNYEEISQKTYAQQEEILINYANNIFNNLLRGRGN